jgi:hypothetical protein
MELTQMIRAPQATFHALARIFVLRALTRLRTSDIGNEDQRNMFMVVVVLARKNELEFVDLDATAKLNHDIYARIAKEWALHFFYIVSHYPLELLAN